MLLVDANLLIYAYDEVAREHKASRRWLSDLLGGHTPVGFPWISLMAFVRVTTNKKLFDKPYTTDEAFDVVGNWLSAPASRIVHPGEDHLRLVKVIAKANKLEGSDLTDAHLAAIAVEYGCPLATTDTNFPTFDGLKLINPLSLNKN
jgi:toxin-antitoxin system PIN domain toxin